MYFLKDLKKTKKLIKKNWLVLLFLILTFLFFIKGKFFIPEFNPVKPSKLKQSFLSYIFWHLQHTIAETIPWYWGVFNWLGVTLPRWVNRVQARILVVASLGIIVYFIRQIKKKKLLTTRNLQIIFLSGSAAIYYFSIIIWDFFFRQGHGFSFGIQGRYFFPTIVCHLFFILLGLLTLTPQKLKKLVVKLLDCWWLVLSLSGLYQAATAYYKPWPLATFLNQLSQYKPVGFKSPLIVFFTLAFFATSLLFMIKLKNLDNGKD